MSQSALAQDLVSPSYVSLIEAGKRLPERAILEPLAERLGTTPEFLETGVDPLAVREELLTLRFAELTLANGQVVEALQLLEQLLETGQHHRQAAEWARARALEALGDLPAAIGSVERLLAEHRAGTADTPGLLTLLNARCRLYCDVGDLDYSISLGEQALEEVRQLGLTGTEDEIRLASTLVSSYWERGDWVRANRLATEVVERAQQHGSPRARGSAYWNASLAASSTGGLSLAVELAERAIASYSETDDDRGIAKLRTTLGWLLLHQQPLDLPRVHELLSKAHQTFSELQVGADLAYCEAELARYHLVVGETAQALELVDRAIARLSDRDVLETARLNITRAYILHATGAIEAALASYRDATRALRRQHKSRQQMATWREAAELMVRLGRPIDAVEAYRALADCAGMPEPIWVSASASAAAADDRARSAVG
jgi:tetratricopeptide (TPR) repeat protein